MKKFVLLMIALLAISVTAYTSETPTTDKSPTVEPSKPSFEKADIKKDAPEVKPNIPDDYKPLIEVYNRYWNFIKENDLENAYKLESDDYKKVVSLREYKGLQKRSKLPVNIKAVRALEVTQKGEKEVIVKGTIWLKAADIDTLKVFYDKWVKNGDEWRHLREIEDLDTARQDKS